VSLSYAIGLQPISRNKSCLFYLGPVFLIVIENVTATPGPKIVEDAVFVTESETFKKNDHELMKTLQLLMCILVSLDSA